MAVAFDPAMSKLLPVCVLAALVAPACVIADDDVFDDDDGVLTVANQSSFVIEEIRVAQIDDPVFGRDLTGRDVLFPGESITVELDCDFYDILFVDEFDVECTVFDIDVCVSRTLFVVDDLLLDDCSS